MALAIEYRAIWVESDALVNRKEVLRFNMALGIEYRARMHNHRAFGCEYSALGIEYCALLNNIGLFGADVGHFESNIGLFWIDLSDEFSDRSQRW